MGLDYVNWTGHSDGQLVSQGSRNALLGASACFPADPQGYLVARDTHEHVNRRRTVVETPIAQPENGGPDKVRRREAEESLRAAEERHRAFVNASSEAICRWEQPTPVPIDLPIEVQVETIYREGYVAECNDAYARKYGLSGVADTIGRAGPAFERISVEEAKARIRSFVSSGYRFQQTEVILADVDGRTRYYLTNYVGVVEDGKFLRAWGTSREITELKIAEQALRDSEEQYRGIFEGSTTGISLRTPEGKIVAANPALCRMYGYTLEEYLQKTPAQLAHPDSLPLFHQLRETVLAGKQFHAEGRGIHKDGHVIEVEVTGTMVLYRGTPHILASLLDITERKRAEERLRQTADDLERKNIALGQVLEHLEGERKAFKHEISDSIEKLLMPVVERLRKGKGTLKPRDVAVLEDTLSSIIRRDIDLFQSNVEKLSPRELDIVALIKQGLGSKEIAAQLNLSEQTIHKHRKLIRQKLQLRNKAVNLAAYLRSR